MLSALVGLALAAPVPVDLAARSDHDLFVTAPGAAPYYRVAVPAEAPWPLALGWDWRAAPDAIALRPEAPVVVDLPGGRTVYVLVAGAGGLGADGVAADVTLRFADGSSRVTRWRVGEDLGPAWAAVSGRASTPLPVGENPAGDPLAVSLLTLEADRPVAALTLTARPGPLSTFLLAVAVDDAPPRLADGGAPREAFDGLDWRVAGTLDRPVGPPLPRPAGPVRVEGGHFVDATGARARFWGVNLVQEAAVPAPELATTEARTLAALGFNLARLHHLDAPGVLLDRGRSGPGAPLFDPAALDRLDRFAAALAAEGVHLALPGLTRRSFRDGEVPDPAGVPVGHKYVAAFRPEWLAAEQAQVRALWDRVNPHTGRRWLDDPHVAWIELGNENSLVAAWHAGALERLPAPHRAALDRRWNAWLRARYGGDARLAAAWTGSGRPGLAAGEALVLDSVAREPVERGRAPLFPPQRVADLVTFYQELEAARLDAMARFWREELGWKGPIVCDTSFGVPAAEALYARCDVVDLHVYWDAAVDVGAVQDWSLVQRAGGARVVEQLSWCRPDRACVIGELNHTFPSRWGFEAPLVWAALAGRQDLDAVTWFAWSHGAFRPDPDGPAGGLDLEGRTELLAQMPVAAALFRSGAMPVPERLTVRWWSRDGLLRDLVEPPGAWLAATFDWRAYLDQRVKSRVGGPAPVPALAPPAGPSPIGWWPAEGRFAVDLPGLAARLGGGGEGALTVDLRTPAAVWLLPLDGRPLGEARELHLVAVGRTEREGTVRGVGPGVVAMGGGPARTERLRGEVTLTVPGRPRAWALDGRGAPVAEVPLTRAGRGRWTLRLDGLASPWVRISAG